LRRALGELDAEDFYRGDKRVQKSRAAQQALEAELRDKGIEVVQVLIRRYTYDQRYQQAIEQRKIQDQTVYKNEAEAKSASAAAAKNKIVAEGAAAVQVELARGEAEVKKLEAARISAPLRRSAAKRGPQRGCSCHMSGRPRRARVWRPVPCASGAETWRGLRRPRVSLRRRRGAMIRVRFQLLHLGFAARELDLHRGRALGDDLFFAAAAEADFASASFL